MVHLLRHQIILLAMKHGRAPVSISPALRNGLARLGALNDLYDLGSIARRLSFLGDGRILLAELKTQLARRPTGRGPVIRENETDAERHP